MKRWSHGWLILLLLADSSALVRGQSVPKDGPKSSGLVPAPIVADKLTPSHCILRGKVEGDYAIFQAHYELPTFSPRCWVFVGLQGAFLADEGKLNGQIPILKAYENGVEVFVEKAANENKADLSFRVPIKVRRSGTTTAGLERSLEFGLPGAAVNMLSFELPGSVKELRVNDYLELPKQPGRWNMSVGPGPVERLRISWKEPIALPGGGPMLTSDASIHVTVDDAQVETRAELLLEDLRGQSKEWHFLLPLQARVEVESSGLPPDIIEPDEKSPFHIVRFSEPSRQSFKLKVSEERPLDEVRGAVGPFYLMGATRQSGTIAVKKLATGLQGKRLEFQRRPMILAKAITQADTLAEFQYWSLPRLVKGTPLPKLRNEAILVEFLTKPDRGQFEAHVEHALRLQPATDAWQVEDVMLVKIKSQTGLISFVDVQLPRGQTGGMLSLQAIAPSSGFPGALPWLSVYHASQPYWPVAVSRNLHCEQLDGPQPLVQGPDDQQRCRVSLAGQAMREFTLVLSSEYLLPRGTRQAKLQLPVLIGGIDRGAKIVVSIDEQYELTNTDNGPALTKHRKSWDASRTPDEVELAWKPYQPELSITGVVDVTIFDQHARIRQKLQFPATGSIPELPENLRGPVMSFQIPGTVRNLDKMFFGYDAARKLASAAVHADEPLVFEYSVGIPQGEPRTFSLPLIWPAKATRIDAKVRIWTPAGTLPRVASPDGVWDNLLTEFVSGQSAMPALVLHGAGSKLPLTLQLERPPQANLADIVFDRGLVEIHLEPNGEQSYRMRFLVQKFNVDSLRITFPAPVADTVQSIRLDDVELPWSMDGVNRVRLQLGPEIRTQPTILELNYQLPAAAGNSWHTMLRMPKLEGNVALSRGIRWQITTPDRITPFIINDDAHVEYRWGLLNNWLPAPMPAVSTGDVEQWLTRKAAVSVDGEANLLFYRASLDPLRLWHVSQPILFAICSATFLFIGLGLHLAPISRYSFWFLFALLGMFVLAASIFWPSVLPIVIFGIQPGFAILVVILALQWLLHERYRRQLVFLPGFTRRKANSSVVRKGPRRDASTIDAPTGAELSSMGHGT